MTVRKRDRCHLPGESNAVTVRAVDDEGDEVALVFERADGTTGLVALTPEAFGSLEPIRLTGAGSPILALAALWGHWMARVTATVRQTTLATTPVRAYAHQDDAVYGAMLPQPVLRFLLADEPGTGKTLMAGMYITEMRRLGLLRRVLLVVPAHLVPKWERDLLRFFGIHAERLTAGIGRSVAPLRPDQDIWVASVDLLARNHQVQAKALLGPEGAWDLVVCDEAHRLTPSAQALFALAIELSRRSTHLLLLTATPHRGSEYLFRALLHLLDPQIYPWAEGDRALLEEEDVPRLRPAGANFIRRMKESLRAHDGITHLFPVRRAHNVPVRLGAVEQQLYDDVLAYCDRFFADASGMVRSVYGKRHASSLHALARTLARRADRLGARGAHETPRGLAPVLDFADLADEGEDEGEAVESAVNDLASSDTSAERAAVADLLARADAVLVNTSHVPAKWEALQQVLPRHGILPGSGEQLLVFTEFADSATWLADRFRLAGYSVRRYAGDVPPAERERIQEEFQTRAFEVLVSTDAGNEGIDLQSAHVMVNWDIPWSIVRLEQRVGRLHRIGQRSRVDVYNLIAASTREGRVQEVMLGNIVAAAEALDGKLFDFLGAVVDAVGLDYTGLLARAGRSDRAADDAASQARRVGAEEYKRAAEEQREIEDRLAVATDTRAFAAHQQQDRLDAVNPAIVEAFVRAVAAARGWRIEASLHTGLVWLDARDGAPLLGSGRRALVAFDADALARARREGADLAGAVVLGPAEVPYRLLVGEAARDGADALAMGAVLEDPSALTPYELLIYEGGLERRRGGRAMEVPMPLLVRSDGAGCRVVAWPGIAHLQVPARASGSGNFAAAAAVQAEITARMWLERQAEELSGRLREWAGGVEERLDWLQDAVLEPYASLPPEQRRAKRAAVAAAIEVRKRQLASDTGVRIRPPRLLGRVGVLAAGGAAAQRVDGQSEARSMLLVAEHLEGAGFHVDDVHQDGCGYDLLASRGHEQRCVEVKGLVGDVSPGIMMEASEWLMAQQLREDYWVYVAVECASAPRLFGAFRNPVALFGETKQLVQRFHVRAPALREAQTCD